MRWLRFLVRDVVVDVVIVVVVVLHHQRSCEGQIWRCGSMGGGGTHMSLGCAIMNCDYYMAAGVSAGKGV